MHEVSLGQVIRDYLTGEELTETTYEEFRQALARLLVEEKGYPKDRLRPKVGVRFPIDGKDYCRVADLVAYGDDGRPLLVVMFCPGEVSSFMREVVALARLVADGPAPLALVTDLREALLIESGRGGELGAGMRAIPDWDRLRELSAGVEVGPLTEDRLPRERRILYAYSELTAGGCCGANCEAKPAG